MSGIGGYFELELHKGGRRYHDTPYALKSGRASLCHILAYTKPSLVHIPFYACDALLEPFQAMNIPYSFYAINESLAPASMPALKDGEYFLYVNYMGLQHDVVDGLKQRYPGRLILDNTQAFFSKGDGATWSFNSCRKFFGVPDGSYLYAPLNVELSIAADHNEDYITGHLLKRYNGHTREGYPLFSSNEELVGKGMQRMSRISETLLSHVDYEAVIGARIANYNFLHEKLKHANLFLAEITKGTIPMCYPYMPAKRVDKALLAEKNIFVPSFWSDALNRGVDGYETEKKLAKELSPLPIDHRYTIADMAFILETLADA